jgi:hypothetical protein
MTPADFAGWVAPVATIIAAVMTAASRSNILESGTAASASA